MLIGIDLGATNVRVGRVVGQDLAEVVSAPIAQSEDPETLLTQIKELIQELMHPDVHSIGIGVPSVVDVEKGIVYDVQNIPSWKEVPLKEIIEHEFGIPTWVNNDANCFALGHAHYDVCKKWRNFAALTLGTGLGMVMIINGELYSGLMSGAGEIGMVPYRDGIVEDYAASQFFVRQFGMSAEKLHQMALDCDPMALDAFSQYGNELGNALKIVMSMMAPEGIVLGGSIAKAHEFSWSSMIMSLEHFEYRAQLEQTSVVTSEHSDIALLGAAALCWA